jgi:hypothetical protein
LLARSSNPVIVIIIGPNRPFAKARHSIGPGWLGGGGRVKGASHIDDDARDQ